MNDNVKIFNYKRGVEYSVNVIVVNNDTFLFRNIKHPKKSSQDSILYFLELAELKVNSIINNETDYDII